MRVRYLFLAIIIAAACAMAYSAYESITEANNQIVRALTRLDV